MNAKLEALFNQPERRYLSTAELNQLSQYANSLPERLKVYRQLRDQEIAIMQPVADALETQLPQAPIETIEQCIKRALMVLRYCAMAMLLDDAALVEQRLQGWRPLRADVYNTQAVDQVLYPLLNQRLTEVFAPPQIHLLRPALECGSSLVVK